MDYTSSQKGLFLIAALFGITIVLIIGTVVSALVLGRVEIRQDFDESGISFYAADSGIEKGLRVNTCLQLLDELERTTCLDAEVTAPPGDWTDWNCADLDYDPFVCLTNAFAQINGVATEREVAYGSETATFTLSVVTSTESATCKTAYCVVAVGNYRTARRTIEAEVQGVCFQPLDVMFAIDRSSSMDNEGLSPDQPFTDVLNAAQTFTQNILTGRDQAGVVWYSSPLCLVGPPTCPLGPDTDPPDEDPSFERALTLDLASVGTGIGNGIVHSPYGRTAMGTGIDRAHTLLNAGKRVEAKQVIIVMGDGDANWPDPPPSGGTPVGYAIEQAGQAKAEDVEVFAIGYLGTIPPAEQIALKATLDAVASTPTEDHVYTTDDRTTLNSIYLSIAQIACQAP
jgi:hypothetical protein